jgi:hypothetical protein
LLLTGACADRRTAIARATHGGAADGPAPFHGYYFRMLMAQGAHAPGGALSYVTGGQMSGGFALVAWPAAYDETGVMTFIVNQDGVVYQRDLGPDTSRVVEMLLVYDPDESWLAVGE